MSSPTRCPNCDCATYPASNGHCPDCNYPPTRRLVLTGDLGQLSCGIRTKLGSTILARLSSEAQFAERDEQFTVFPCDSDWFVVPRMDTKNFTLLNGSAIFGEARLNDGDALALGSRTVLDKQVMVLRLSMGES